MSKFNKIRYPLIYITICPVHEECAFERGTLLQVTIGLKVVGQIDPIYSNLGQFVLDSIGRKTHKKSP